MGKRMAACLMAVIFMATVLTGCDLPFTSPGQSTPPASDPAAPPKTESTPPAPSEPKSAEQPVTLYLPNENVDGFITKVALTDGSPGHIVSLLVEEKALPEGCAILAFASDGRHADADMNAAYGAAVNEGTTAEYLRLGCVVNTLLTFFELEEITITIEGEILETGHETYKYPLSFYEDQVADLGNPVDGDNNPVSKVQDDDNHPSVRAQDYDVPVLIGNLPRSDAVDCVWTILGGYWTATDDLYVAFQWNEGLPCVTYGIWDAGGIGFGELVNADPMSDYEFALSILFPAIDGDEVAPAREESTMTVFIDMSGLDQDGKINIKIESHGNGGYYTYAYGGATAEEAYQSLHR